MARNEIVPFCEANEAMSIDTAAIDFKALARLTVKTFLINQGYVQKINRCLESNSKNVLPGRPLRPRINKTGCWQLLTL